MRSRHEVLRRCSLDVQMAASRLGTFAMSFEAARAGRLTPAKVLPLRADALSGLAVAWASLQRVAAEYPDVGFRLLYPREGEGAKDLRVLRNLEEVELRVQQLACGVLELSQCHQLVDELRAVAARLVDIVWEEEDHARGGSASTLPAAPSTPPVAP